MDYNNEDLDELNEETFGSAEIGDWEFEHEQFAFEKGTTEHKAPDANELPRFWEPSNDLSFLWQAESLDNFKGFFDDEAKERGVNVEETLQKLVSEDETYEDPAILDISKKVSEQRLYGSALEKILGAPAYPTAPDNLLGSTRDIWSSGGVSTSTRPKSYPKPPKKPPSDSLNLLDLIQQIGRSKTPLKTSTASTESSSSSGPAVSIGILQRLLGQRNQPPSDALDINSESNHFQSMISLPDVRTRPPNPPQPLHFPPFQLNLRSILNAPPIVQTASPNPTIPSNPLLRGEARSPAMLFYLMNAWNMQLRARGSNLPDPRIFNCLPPPGHPAFRNHLFAPPGGPPSSFTRPPSNCVLPPALPPWLHQAQPRMPSSMPVYRTNTICGIDDDTLGVDTNFDEVFDPNCGGWMTRYESIGVLLMQLRPLMVSNPYVEDYYFAVGWLRRMTAHRAKQVSSGTLPYNYPSPVMHMPSPVTMEDINNPVHYHKTTSSRRFVMPLALLPLHRPDSPDHSVLSYDTDDRSTPVDDILDDSIIPDSSPARVNTNCSETSVALGRQTRSNVHRPRLIADLSLASALAPDSCTTKATNQKHEEQDTNSIEKCAVSASVRLKSRLPSYSVKSTRHQRMLLARIERMYTLVLHLDEVDLSLARVVVNNEIRNRLIQHRHDLLERLIVELLAHTDKESVPLDPEEQPASSYLELLTRRKGIRLFATVLRYLPPMWAQLCVRNFLLKYDEILVACSLSSEEYYSLLYPSLRQVIYQSTDIEVFMTKCFPEFSAPLSSHMEPTARLKAITTSKLGLSLVFCLLDTCARLSKPNDPSTFIRYAAHFSYLTATQNASDLHQPIETFPHLASIVPVYVIPDQHGVLKAEHLESFCSLISNVVTTSQAAAATTTTGAAEMGSSSVNSTTTVVNGVMHTTHPESPETSKLSSQKSSPNSMSPILTA